VDVHRQTAHSDDPDAQSETADRVPADSGYMSGSGAPPPEGGYLSNGGSPTIQSEPRVH